MDRYYSLASDVLVDIYCIRKVILCMNIINVFSSNENYLASANVGIPKLIVFYKLYIPSMCNRSHCIVYCSFLKSIDFTNRERTFKYLFTRSLLLVVQAPPATVICCFKELL